MKRLIYTMFLIFYQTFTFAQRGKVRPEWDINGGGSHHSIDDDLYSFLFIVGLVALYFLFLAIRGAFSRSQDTKGKIDHSSFGKTYDKLEEGCGTVFGGGCLILMLLAPVAFIIGLVKDCGNDTSNKSKEKTELRKEKKKEKTFVNVLYSDIDCKHFHVASTEEFKGKDTLFYYKSFVYQNRTGRTLALYSVEYCINGIKKVKIIKTIKSGTFFDTGAISITPFETPPLSVDIPIPTGHSRWARSQRTKATRTLYFLDFLENVPKNL